MGGAAVPGRYLPAIFVCQIAVVRLIMMIMIMIMIMGDAAVPGRYRVPDSRVPDVVSMTPAWRVSSSQEFVNTARLRDGSLTELLWH